MDISKSRRWIFALTGFLFIGLTGSLPQPLLGMFPPQQPKSPKAGKSKPKEASQSEGFRDSFQLDKKNLASTGTNPYFILEVGYRCFYEHKNDKLTITVLPDTKVVDGVETRVVEEREEAGGKLKEVSRNYYAIDKTTKDVYYFGEDVDNYKNGKLVNHSGGWLAGEKGARFGLMMPGQVKVGDKFYQELAPKKAMDRAEVIGLDEKMSTPAGAYEKCVHMKETTPIEDDVSHKWYAPGVGLVKDDEMVLVRVEKPKS